MIKPSAMISRHLSVAAFSPSNSIAFVCAIKYNKRLGTDARSHLLKLNLADKFLCRCQLRFYKVVLRFELDHLLKVGDCLCVLEYLQVASSASKRAFNIQECHDQETYRKYALAYVGSSSIA